MRRALLGLLGLVALSAPAAAQTITAARYADPVTRYGHNALGPGHEWGALLLTLSDGRHLRLTLPPSRVFEDIAPRLADLTGDGIPEVTVVEASLTLGARLAVYDQTGLVAATAFLGRPNRWLAPVGIADLDGDGITEIAYVETPHLAKVLKVVRLSGTNLAVAASAANLTLAAKAAGLTTHRFGDGFFQGGIARCADGPAILTANADWTRVMASRLRGGTIVTTDIGPYSGPASLAAAPGC